jgi:hypothetical protein
MWQINDSTGWNFVQDTANSYGEIDGTPLYPTIRDAMGAHEIDFGGNVEETDIEVFGMGTLTDILEVGYMTPGDGETWIWEFKIEKPSPDAFNNESIWVHLNVGCGNDLLVSEIPEPTTMLLFGMGLLGSGSMFRRRKK